MTTDPVAASRSRASVKNVSCAWAGEGIGREGVRMRETHDSCVFFSFEPSANDSRAAVATQFCVAHLGRLALLRATVV